ncbi:MAG: deoxyribodipyrimidine photo-lyase [Bacteroidetes bacterium]|nr:deoxyribodipyrimidine photo-lyase [Bacteroidota bacterium]
MSTAVSIFWFRRDLRLHDNAGLYHALHSGHPVVPVFIFDTNILDDLKNREDKRLVFIRDCLLKMQEQLEKKGSTLHVLHGTPMECFKKLVAEYNIAAVYTNNDYEPYAAKRDKEIKDYLATQHIVLHSYKDQVIFEQAEIVKDNGEPYTVYTPYSKRWKEKLNDFYLKPYPVEKYARHFYTHAPHRMPSLEVLGFKDVAYDIPPAKLDEDVAKHYSATRDFPAQHGTTRLSVHLRFGTISIRELAAEVKKLNATLLNELIWREFYQMILWHFPQVVNKSFKEQYDKIHWRNNEKEFEKWCKGETGYPIVDAGMRQLNETGYMHNRVRMITASFLTKHLLIDWRWGEAYFAEKLMDYDLAANNGGWQWSAGTGCDAAPHFRIFNPYIQTKKFDFNLEYIKRWVPEYDELTYPLPIVEHEVARERCLREYKKALLVK